MKWMPKNSTPQAAGWFYVRSYSERRSAVEIRYFDDSNKSWWLPKRDGMTPNDNFSEWLLVPRLNQRN